MNETEQEEQGDHTKDRTKTRTIEQNKRTEQDEQKNNRPEKSIRCVSRSQERTHRKKRTQSSFGNKRDPSDSLKEWCRVVSL